MTALATHIQRNDSLAKWLGVKEVALVREDLLPDGGGKKRRALGSLAENLKDIEHIHLLSYAGSHTAFTLAQLLPQVKLHLYGTHYGGGPYENTMLRLLNEQSNIIQTTGSPLKMSREFNRQKRRRKTGHHFMKIGGSLGQDQETTTTVEKVVSELGMDFHHFTAVASGDLLKNIQGKTEHVTGVLTQPLGIRIIKSFHLNNTRGILRQSLDHRIALMTEIREITGQLWDPVFMGVVFSFIRQQKKLPPNICIWITCPSGIDWMR
ncbi:hypothetical protein HQ531_13350 [bacterium]|nr:hypothetical protein [bacterium]